MKIFNDRVQNYIPNGEHHTGITTSKTTAEEPVAKALLVKMMSTTVEESDAFQEDTTTFLPIANE